MTSSASLQTSAKKRTSLGYEGSIEKARRAIAQNELSKYEEKKRHQKEEAARQRRAKAEQLMLARKREEEARWSGEELGERLLASLKEQVQARIEAQIQDEVQASAEEHRDTWYARFVELEKMKISGALRIELEPLIRAQMAVDLAEEVKQTLKNDLTSEVRLHLKDELTSHVEEEIREEMRAGLRAEVIDTLARENLNMVLDDLRAEHRNDVINQLRKEAHTRSEEHLQANSHNETIPGEPNMTTSMPNGVKDGQSEGQDETPMESFGRKGAGPDEDAKTQQDHAARAGHEQANDAQMSSDVNYPKLEAPEGLETANESTSISTPEKTDSARFVAQQPPLDEDVDASTGAYDTTPERKDFTFDPEKHDIKFSSPAPSESSKKRSLSQTDEFIGEQSRPAKKLRDEPQSGDEEAVQDEHLTRGVTLIEHGLRTKQQEGIGGEIGEQQQESDEELEEELQKVPKEAQEGYDSDGISGVSEGSQIEGFGEYDESVEADSDGLGDGVEDGALQRMRDNYLGEAKEQLDEDDYEVFEEEEVGEEEEEEEAEEEEEEGSSAFQFTNTQDTPIELDD